MKQHGNTGKQNALKGESAATSFLHIRVTPQTKALYVKQAQSEKLKLSEWVIRALNKEAGRGDKMKIFIMTAESEPKNHSDWFPDFCEGAGFEAESQEKGTRVAGQ